MKSLIRQLDRDETLLMYLADELPADDRQDVEQMLTTDADMRAELDALRATQSVLEAGLVRADAGPSPIDPRVAQRHIGWMIREWQGERARLAAPADGSPAAARSGGLRYPWWTYPLTAAAAVALAFVVWWGNTPIRNYDQRADTQPVQSDDARRGFRYGWSQDFVADALERSFQDPSHEGILEAEGELLALSRIGDDTDPTLQQDVNQ